MGCIIDWNKSRLPTEEVIAHLGLGSIRSDAELVRGLKVHKNSLSVPRSKSRQDLAALCNRSLLLKNIFAQMGTRDSLHQHLQFQKDEGLRSRDKYRKRDVKNACRQAQCNLLMSAGRGGTQPRLRTGEIAAQLGITAKQVWYLSKRHLRQPAVSVPRSKDPKLIALVTEAVVAIQLPHLTS